MKRLLKDPLTILKGELVIPLYRKILDLAAEGNVPAWNILADSAKYPGHFNAGTVRKLSLYADLIKTLSLNADKSDAYSKAKEIAYGQVSMKRSERREIA